ncbi:aminodeoxychorismate lyase [Bacillus shivajii]|uniref:aminodeoxychorismate lyase n=1 Tax=Bacillus shivajii TaxID=1983719 RepID=UPI001CFBE06E|nr:aminodeoxychorismate lyase [Bacillus shivajii]UCZ53332.1 aminodeoxychorismate lyase [Bacillus shivajii]
MYLYMNGDFVKANEAKVSPFDHGFLYGVGLFETFRTYEGHPFLLDDHFRRLHESASEISIKLKPYDRNEVVEIVHELLGRNDLKDGYFRWNVSGGESPVGLKTDPYDHPNTIVFVKPLPPSFSVKKKGKILEQRRNTPETSRRLKSHHFLNNIVGKREAGADPKVEGIFLTEEGYISEGVVSNIFWVKGKTLFTPDLTCGGLNGITRMFIMSLAAKLGFKVCEGRYSLSDILNADEAFVTNSIQEIISLSSIDGHPLPSKMGDVFQMFQCEYRKYTTTLWSREEITKGS